MDSSTTTKARKCDSQQFSWEKSTIKPSMGLTPIALFGVNILDVLANKVPAREKTGSKLTQIHIVSDILFSK